MTDDGTLPDRLRNMVRNPNAIGTHSAACWQWHDDCALLLAADRVAERDADVSAGAVARTVAMSHIAAERDAERAARERAEAEARQLREQDAALVEANRSLGADLERLREAIKTIAWTIDPEDGMTDPALIVVHMEAGALEDLRAAIAAAVAEGAEDRGQTDG